MKGNIFNIQKFSLNDGPGIRTTVFFMGCPLKCWWCHNPESQDMNREILYWESRCIDCKTCHEDYDNSIELTEACPTNAKEMISKLYSKEELVDEVMKDVIFYEQSGGGVTISGGEPMMQLDFLLEVAKELKSHEIHLSLDTTGYCKWEDLSQTIDLIDLYLFDLKHLDTIIHKKMTGVDNHIILENLLKLVASNKKIQVRVPIIPTFNDDLEYIDRLSKWLHDNQLFEVTILPYHNIAIDKYKRLGKVYKHSEINPPSQNEMITMKGIMEKYDLNVTIGG